MNPQTVINAIRVLAINCGYEPSKTSGLIGYIQPKENGLFLVFHHGTPRHIVTTQGTAWVIAGGIQGNSKNLQQRISRTFLWKNVSDKYYLGEQENGEPVYTGPVWSINGFFIEPEEEDITPLQPYNLEQEEQEIIIELPNE